jgi:hypothetical protein
MGSPELALTPQLVRDLVKMSALLTVTRVTVKVAKRLGGYTLELEGPIADALEAMEEDGEIAAVESVSGIAHAEDWSWRFPFRIDRDGVHVSRSAPTDAQARIVPLLTSAFLR